MYSPLNITFSQDRFGNKNSALNFSSGLIRATDGYYFANEFTFLAWVKLNSYVNNQRLFEFGNVYVTLSQTGNQDRMFFRIGGSPYSWLRTARLDLNVWYHLGFLYKNKRLVVYRNYQSTSSGAYNLNTNILRTDCNFGKNGGDFELDDVKIFNVGLEKTEIESEYENGYF